MLNKENQIQKQHFDTLIECQSVYDQIKIKNDKITAEEKRITFLKNQIDSRENEKNIFDNKIPEVKKKLLKNEGLLETNEKKLSSLEKNLNNLKTNKEVEKYESSKSFLNKEIEQSEEVVLNLMEELETLNQKKEETISFLNGANKSLTEISLEVNETIKKYQENISNLENRADSIFNTLPDIVLNNSKLTFTKYKFTKPLSSLNNNNCSTCFFQVPSLLVEDVERRTKIIKCPQCTRILLPNF
jgi:predicted  nucleic acid-binding Zn-ribbon protein